MEEYDHEGFLEYMYEAGWREYAPGQWVLLGEHVDDWRAEVDKVYA